jgi:hypothetical protein
MMTFYDFIEVMAMAAPAKFDTNMPVQQQIVQILTTLQAKLNSNPYMDVSKTIDFYTKKFSFTYGPKAAEYWQRKTANMIKNMQAQQQAFAR